MKFVDLDTQFKRIEKEVRAAIDRVLKHGQFIMGPEVFELEKELAAYCGAKHAISAASGTDALLMALLAHEVGPGDAIIAPPFTFVATAEVVQLLGATPVFVDVEESSFNLDATQLPEAIERIQAEGKLNLKGIIAVDLFGLPADYDAIEKIAHAHDLFVLADSAQSFGGRLNKKKAGTFGDITATSFFPAKPLGGYGDGGAVFTHDDNMAEILRSIRIHGMGADRYENVRIGITGRLDTIQAAILRCKLKLLDEEIVARQRVADLYTRELEGVVNTPRIPSGYQSAWAQYTVRAPNRESIREKLQTQDIPTAVYYPRPLHQQPAFRKTVDADLRLPVSEMLAEQVFSLPIHPYLDEPQQMKIIEAIKSAV